VDARGTVVAHDVHAKRHRGKALDFAPADVTNNVFNFMVNLSHCFLYCKIFAKLMYYF